MSEPDPTPEASSEETSDQAEGQPLESAATPPDPAPFASFPLPVPEEPHPELEDARETPPVRPTLAFPVAAPAERPEPSLASPPADQDSEAAHPVEPPASVSSVGTPSAFETPPPVPAPLFEDASTSAPDPVPSGPFGGMPEVPLPAAGPPPAPVPLPDAVPYPVPPPPSALISPPPPPAAEVPVPAPPVAEVPPPAPSHPAVAEPAPPAPPVAQAKTPAAAPFAKVLQVGEFAALAAPEPEPEPLPDPVPALPEPAADGQGITDIDGKWIVRSSRGGSKVKLPGRLGRKKPEDEASGEEPAPVAEEGAPPALEDSVPESGKKRRTGFTLGRKKAEATPAVPAEATPAVPAEAKSKRRARFSLGRKKNEDDFPSDPSDWQEAPDESPAPAAEAPAWSQAPIPAPPIADPATTQPSPPDPPGAVSVPIQADAFADVAPPPVIPEAVVPPAPSPTAPDSVGGVALGDSMWGVAPAAAPDGFSGARPGTNPAPAETARRGRFSFSMPFSRKPKGPGSQTPGTSFPKGPKTFVSVIVVLALVVAGVGYMFLGRSGSGGPSPAFALDLVAGQSYAYHFNFNIQGSAVAGGQTLPVNESIAATMDWNVQSVDPSGVATVGVAMSDFHFTVNGKALPASQLPSTDASFTMRVDRDGRILSSGGAFGDALAGTGASAGGLPGSNQLTPLLPGHDVKPGDTWAKTFKQDLPLGMGTLKYKTQSRYVRDEQLDGVNAAVIETRMNIPLHMKLDLAKVLQASGSQESIPAGTDPVIRYRGHSNMVDTGWFDPEQRQMVKMQVSGSFNMDMTFEGMSSGTVPNGSSVSFRGAMTMNLERA